MSNLEESGRKILKNRMGQQYNILYKLPHLFIRLLHYNLYSVESHDTIGKNARLTVQKFSQIAFCK